MLAAVKSHPLEDIAQRFQQDLPHTKPPYNSRAWGHGLHSLCSYQGKLKPALAHWMVEYFTSPGARVLDPLGGVGTVAFEAGLLGRANYTCDLSPFASSVLRAKTAPPSVSSTLLDIDRFEAELHDVTLTPAELGAAEFGLNARVTDYYHPETLLEVLKARRLLSAAELSPERAFVKACVLHILHGNRPYALSRTSHPITPFSPTGPAEYRSLISRLRQRCARLLELELPIEFQRGQTWHADFRQLPDLLPEPVDAVVCSPPFPGMRFDRPNWLRMWFCGWGEGDFRNTSRSFLERQQGSTFEIYRDFFAMCCEVTTSGSPIVLHVGGSKGYEMAEKLVKIGADFLRHVATINEHVGHLEKHGIRDKGLTSAHILLVFERP